MRTKTTSWTPLQRTLLVEGLRHWDRSGRLRDLRTHLIRRLGRPVPSMPDEGRLISLGAISSLVDAERVDIPKNRVQWCNTDPGLEAHP